MLHRFVPPSERFTLFHLLPIRIYFMAKNTHGLGTCSELTGFIIKQKPHLAVSFLDTVMIFYYIHGLPTTEILPCRVQSISHRESLANLTALHMLLVPDPKQIRPCWKPQPSDFSSASHLSPFTIISLHWEHPLSLTGMAPCVLKNQSGTVSKILMGHHSLGC